MTQEEKQPVVTPEAETVQAASKPQPTAVAKASGARGGMVLGTLAIAISLGLASWIYADHQQQQARITELQSQVESQLTDAGLNMGKMIQAFNQEQAQKQQQEQQQLQAQIETLQNRVLDLNDKRPNDWMLAESEYLVRMAGRKLWLEHDLVSAITLLGNADERIAALNDPSLMPIRKALAEDIAKLKGMPRIDREGLTLKLAALEDQIELLPLSAVNMPQSKQEQDQEVSTNPGEWESNLKKNWVRFTENFVTIRRRDGAVEALLSPQQEFFLRENLRTKLLQAQLSVYREQQGLYEDSLEKTQRWLNQYFDTDNSATRYLLGELDKLKGEQIQIDYPTQFKTQAMLEEVLTERLQRILASS